MPQILDLKTEVTKFKQWQPPHEQRNGEWECAYEQWEDPSEYVRKKVQSLSLAIAFRR